MDPVVGSLDMIGSNSNSAGCLINLCSLCNLQFSDNVETDNGQDGGKVEKILSEIFLSDDDEHGQVQLCFSCKMLCTNLIGTKQSLLFIIDNITTLLLQNSRFTLVNPKCKIIPKLFQFRFTRTSPPSSARQQRTSFATTNSVCDNPAPGNAPLDSMDPTNQSSPNSQFIAMYLSNLGTGDSNASSNNSARSVDVQLLNLDCTPPTRISERATTLMYQSNDEVAANNVGSISVPSELAQLSTIDRSLNTPPFPSSYEMAAAKEDDMLLTDLDSLNFPIETSPENLNIQGNENVEKRATCLGDNVKLCMASPTYICEICGKSYLHKKRLEAHIGHHKLETKFQCTICHKTFTQKCGLQRHLPVHTGELPFQCSQCDKRFRHHSSLNIHKLTHDGKKQFSCHSCDISFISTSHLRRHQKSHSGFKPFSCNICPRAFSEKYNLESHVRTHTGETAYKCPHCPLGFNRKKKLKHHLTSSHSAK